MHRLSDLLSVWTTTRAAGLTAYLLLFVSTAAGLAISGRMTGKRTKAVMLAVHQWSGWFGLLFGMVHGAVLAFDRYVGYAPFELLVPFASNDHRLLNGIGTLTLYITVILIASSDLMKRLGKKAWRAIHFLAFAAYGMALVHGMLLGTDTKIGWIAALYGATGAAAAVLLAVRIRGAIRRRAAAAPVVEYIPPTPPGAGGRPPQPYRLR